MVSNDVRFWSIDMEALASWEAYDTVRYGEDCADLPCVAGPLDGTTVLTPMRYRESDVEKVMIHQRSFGRYSRYKLVGAQWFHDADDTISAHNIWTTYLQLASCKRCLRSVRYNEIPDGKSIFEVEGTCAHCGWQGQQWHQAPQGGAGQNLRN